MAAGDGDPQQQQQQRGGGASPPRRGGSGRLEGDIGDGDVFTDIGDVDFDDDVADDDRFGLEVRWPPQALIKTLTNLKRHHRAGLWWCLSVLCRIVVVFFC